MFQLWYHSGFHWSAKPCAKHTAMATPCPDQWVVPNAAIAANMFACTLRTMHSFPLMPSRLPHVLRCTLLSLSTHLKFQQYTSYIYIYKWIYVYLKIRRCFDVVLICFCVSLFLFLLGKSWEFRPVAHETAVVFSTLRRLRDLIFGHINCGAEGGHWHPRNRTNWYQTWPYCWWKKSCTTWDV